MATVPCLSTNVVALTVEAFIASLNVAVMDTFLGAPVEAFVGVVDCTEGAVASLPGGLVGESSLQPAVRTATSPRYHVIDFFN
jgi:hypothetical protein